MPERFGELPGRGLVVARDDRDVLDPALAEPLDDLADLGPDRRPQLDRAAEPVVDAHHDHRVPLAVRLVQGLADLGRQRDPFHLQEPLAADADGVPVEVDGDAVADLVLGVVGRRQGQAQLLGLVQDRQGDRVVELPLGGRREPEDLLRVEARRPR